MAAKQLKTTTPRRGIPALPSLVLTASLLTALAITLSGCSDADGTDDAPAGPSYKEVTPERGTFRIIVNANGLVRPIDRIELKSKASGEVIELPIEVGQQIARGTVIAKLDPIDARTALEQTQADHDIALAELALAEKNFERRKELFGRNVISLEAQDQTELDLAVARGKRIQTTTARERAEERMRDTTITAPVDGIILQKYVEKGQIIASGVSNVGGGSPIADIADMSAIHIEAGVDEIDIGKIQVGQHATIRAEAYPDIRYSGTVARIAPEARLEQIITLFDVITRVENIDGNLKSGMNATVEIVVVEVPDVLTIPITALQDRGDSLSAGEAQVLVKQGDVFGERAIQIGRNDHRVVEVTQGLSEGDVLGIPMVSRLKRDHERLDSRIRQSRSFGAGAAGDKKPKKGKSPSTGAK